MSEQGGVQKNIVRIQKNPVVFGLVFLSTVLAGVLSFTDDLTDLWERLFPEERISVDGEWMAEVTYPWIPQKTFEERFKFTMQGNQIAGVAGFLGRPRMIHNGSMNGYQLSFDVQFESTFSTDAESQPDSRHYQGWFEKGAQGEESIWFTSMSRTGDAELFEFKAIRVP